MILRKGRDRARSRIERRMAEITGAGTGASRGRFIGRIALGRARTPGDDAAFVSWLAAPESDPGTGPTPLVDGGLAHR